jgi:predicted ATP-dependent endonuclease of OLD family
MRLSEVRISGFKSIPFCAEILPQEPASGRHAAPVQIVWQPDAFAFHLPTAAARGPERGSMLCAITGANSAGKSSILLALSVAFSAAAKLQESYFNGRETGQPIIIELTLRGCIAKAGDWHALNCIAHGDDFELTVAHAWTTESRTRYIRRSDGLSYRQSAVDRSICESLMPELRIIWADGKLADEADLEKKNLISDLIEGLLEREQADDSIILRIGQLLRELERLVDRAAAPDAVSWRAIEELEARLSQGLASITPQRNRVRLRLKDSILSVRNLFARGVMVIDDGIELDFTRHGLGVQRSFVVSTLHAWCETIKDASRDYLFAIEEPEIYLHPHATRMMLNTLEKIAAQDQVLFTTHAGEFVNRVPLPNILTVKRQDRAGQVRSQVVQPDLLHLSPEELTKVQRYLREDRSDMLFARAVLLVEGQAEHFALPGFARTLALDLDAGGVSVVFVNGVGNFAAYHQILAAFAIPHVILVDGDGRKADRECDFAPLANAVFVLERDFEHLVAGALKSRRLLAIVNECLRRRGKAAKTALGPNENRARLLTSMGKPLVGRVVAERLTRQEVEAMPELVEALRTVVELAQGRSMR